MDNFFLVEAFNWGSRDRGKWMQRAQRVLRKLGIPWVLQRAMDPFSEMTNFEQRANLWHFASQAVAYGVPGDFAEFGCFDGKTATIFQKVIDQERSGRRLHLFDHFELALHLNGRNIRAELERNFERMGVGAPVIHEGKFVDTVPAELPAQIAFMHIDCGFGGNADEHEATVLQLLEHIYPRMTPGAIGVLMDCHLPGRHQGPDWNPGAGRAARKFLADKPEKLSGLWAGEYNHSYFRRLAPGS